MSLMLSLKKGANSLCVKYVRLLQLMKHLVCFLGNFSIVFLIQYHQMKFTYKTYVFVVLFHENSFLTKVELKKDTFY